jgi:GntR family transcriptional regulator / MocR family aminotransferase
MVLGKLLQLTSKRDTSSANAPNASGTASSLGNDELFWGALFRGMDRGGSFLQLQIRQIIVAAIEDGRLPLGMRMPSSRDLATVLKISRNTVVIAYEQLVDQNFLVSRQRSGYFVAGLSKKIVSARPKPSEAASRDDTHWSARYAVRPSAHRNISKPTDWQAYPYPFIFGQFDPSLFPTNDWRESARAALSVPEINNWARDLIDGDDPALIEQLQLQVLPRRGIHARSNEIMMTIGQTRVGIEEPGYPDARNIFRMLTSEVTPLRSDIHGVLPDEAFASCALAYVTASHQCPTASVMPLQRRLELLQAAKAGDVVLVEDDYEGELMPESAALPPLKSLDRDDNVLYVGSLSKALAPGLRLGYVVAPAPVIRELRALRRLMLRHPPLNNQRVAALFIGLGHYRSHLDQVGRALLERAKILDRLLPIHLPDCTFSRGPGSTNYWIACPEGSDTAALAQAALSRGVVIEPGAVFSMDESVSRHCFRLGFSSIRADRIEVGIEKLGEVIADYLSSRP